MGKYPVWFKKEICITYSHYYQHASANEKEGCFDERVNQNSTLTVCSPLKLLTVTVSESPL